MISRPSRGIRRPWGARGLVPVGLGLGLLLSPGPVLGQAATGTGCDVPHFDRLTNLALSNGSRVTYFSAPVIVCAEGTRISADSAVVYEATNYTQLFRNVVFQDADSRLTADRANYFSQEDRLRAWGSVVLHDLTDGSVIEGDTMVLIRAGSEREQDRLTVTGHRPRATLFPTRQPVTPQEEAVPGDSLQAQAPDPDSAGAPPIRPDSAVSQPETPGAGPGSHLPPEERTPWDIDARRIFLEGSRYFRATGNVNIRRDSVDAVADSVEYDGEAGSLFLSRDARLSTSDFDLTARDIRMDIPQDEIREIEARHESVLESDDFQLLAPTILLFLKEGELEQLLAVRDPVLDSLPEEVLAARTPNEKAEALGFPFFPRQPHAYSEEFMLWGDSVEVQAPGNALERVKAMGRARGESLAGDSLNTQDTPPLIRRDWLEGDTIIAIFASAESPAEAGPAREAPPEIPPPPALERAEPEEEAADSSRYKLERLIAQGSARSLYRMSPSDSSQADQEESRQAIHYVVGDEITILMAAGEVDRMEVKGATRGIHLEPMRPERRRGGGGVDEERALEPGPVTPPDTTGAGRPPGGGAP